MKASELELKKEYAHKGLPGEKFIFTGQISNRYFFYHNDSECWMTEKQVENLIDEL